jgi:hypothetical protein
LNFLYFIYLELPLKNAPPPHSKTSFTVTWRWGGYINKLMKISNSRNLTLTFVGLQQLKLKVKWRRTSKWETVNVGSSAVWKIYHTYISSLVHDKGFHFSVLTSSLHYFHVTEASVWGINIYKSPSGESQWIIYTQIINNLNTNF